MVPNGKDLESEIQTPGLAIQCCLFLSLFLVGSHNLFEPQLPYNNKNYLIKEGNECENARELYHSLYNEVVF